LARASASPGHAGALVIIAKADIESLPHEAPAAADIRFRGQDKASMSDSLACPDPIAERRYAYAKAAADEGDWRAAAEVLEQALERVPGWPPAWFALGEARQRLGDLVGAAQAFRACLEADPEDAQGAAARLSLLGSDVAATSLPAAYVARLFDDYAPRFAAHVTEKLAYRGPEIILAALDAAAPGRSFRAAIDLGCGSGLMGRAIKPRVERLAGVDLSAGMIAQARASNVYDRLEVDEAITFLLAARKRSCDLLLAADALAYFGDLAPLFSAAARTLEPGGLFAFTVEALNEGDYRLRDTMRFAHSNAHVEAAAAAASLRVAHAQDAPTRLEAGAPVPGRAFVLSATEEAPT
jgi:predicted TPR repeat methyltransferase